MDKRIKLSQAAKVLGISYRHAQKMSYEGKIPNIVTDTGRRYVPESWLLQQVGEATKEDGRCAIYSRESSSENKTALKTQTEGLRRYAAARGWPVVHVVEEIGSGVNDQRQKLAKLLT